MLLAGDYISIGQRLYKVLDDVDADSGGAAEINIWPRLRESPGNNTSIVTASCVGLFRLRANTVQIYDVTADLNYSLAFSAEEAL